MTPPRQRVSFVLLSNFVLKTGVFRVEVELIESLIRFSFLMLGAYCDEGDLKGSLSECFGFVRSIVMPNSAQPNVNMRLRMACL